MANIEMLDELTITLRKSITLGTIEYTELKLREPTAGEMQKAGAIASDGMASNILLVSLVTGMPKQAVEKIGARDMHQAVEYLQGFMRGDQATGN